MERMNWEGFLSPSSQPVMLVLIGALEDGVGMGVGWCGESVGGARIMSR